MKKILTLAVVGVFMTASAMAQDSTAVKQHKAGVHQKHQGDGKDHKHHGHKGDKAMKGVTFSDEQKAQAKTINEDFKKKAADVKAKNLDAADQKKQLAALHQERHQKMQQVLTAEQKATIETNRKQAAAKAKEMKGKRLDAMKASLNLNDEQVAKIKEEKAKTREQIKAIRENQSLSEADKKAQVKAVMQKQKASWDNILTPEQKAKMKAKQQPSK
ncbi:hypothetical protein [Filimonas effusa]|uniref:LTXXQ motif family protein n=1 Tax=Filimonas effusa TaxID=2508721 RepID=A0A4Q1D426_9BACT|nr:hypothetical protein [Filimonas effusa]RXK83202.1 hypothetical protein ESB13_13880 [Filimonas effusa]